MAVAVRRGVKYLSRNFSLTVCRVCTMVLKTRETREKTRTRKFGSRAGQISLHKNFRFLGPDKGKPEKFGSGRVSDIFGFLHTLNVRDQMRPQNNFESIVRLSYEFNQGI